ncbi:MAG: bis-aminopropyl spermidine synthase family protein [Candidatus Bathyarchaeia archaeon]
MKKVETQMIKCLLKSKMSFWEILDRNQYTVKDFVIAMNKLFSEGLIGVDGDNIYLTEKGLKYANKVILEFKGEICEKCEGKRIIFDGRFNEVLENFTQVIKDRPLPNVRFFQGYMREQDVISRVALMHHYADLADKSFVLIGDDDLLSVALALTGLPSRILVLDVDAKLGEYIKEICSKYGMKIEFRQYDVSNPLPKDLVGGFDVFSSEPLETISGLKAFISRGIACLKENGVGYVGLSTAEASHRKWRAVERMLLGMNCVITDIIKDFSKYKTLYETANYEMFTARLKFPVGGNPGIYWYKSSLIRFEVLGKPKPAVKPEKHLAIKYFDRQEDITNPFLYIKS